MLFPEGRRRFVERAQLLALLQDSGAKAFEAQRDIPTPGVSHCHQRCGLELKLADPAHEREHASRIQRGRKKGHARFRKRVHAKGHRRDHPQRAARSAHQLGQIESRDRLHHFSAALGANAVAAQDGDADDHIAHRSISRAQRAKTIGRDDSPQRRALGERRLERQPLPIARELSLQLLQGDTGLRGDHLIGRGVLDDAVQSAGVKHGVDRRKRADLRASADEDDAPAREGLACLFDRRRPQLGHHAR